MMRIERTHGDATGVCSINKHAYWALTDINLYH